MNRRTMIRAIAAAAIARPFVAGAREQGKITIAWFATGPIASNMRAFRQALKQRGYADEQVVVDERYLTAGRSYAQIAADVARIDADVIVATGGLASRAAKAAIRTTPIVFLVSDPVASGVVPNLARPTENLTGVALVTHDFNTKRVETIATLMGRPHRIAALGDASGALSPAIQRAFIDESDAAGRQLGIEVHPKIELKRIDYVDDAFEQAVKAGAVAMVTGSSSYFNVHREKLVAAAARTHLPTIYEHRDYVEAGGLISYGSNLLVAFEVAAGYVDRIFKGAKPRELPVEQVSKVELVINRRTAARLKLTVPSALLVRADEVIG